MNDYLLYALKGNAHEADAAWITIILIGGLTGLLVGLLPLGIAFWRRRPLYALSGILTCTLGGAALGLVLAGPTAIVLALIIIAVGDAREETHLDTHTPIRLRRTTLWWIVSGVIHVSIAIIILTFPPIQDWLWGPDEPSPPSELSQDELDEIVAILHRLYEQRMRKVNVRMDEIIAEMNRLAQKRYARLLEADRNALQQDKLVDMPFDRFIPIQAERLADQYRYKDGRKLPQLPDDERTIIELVDARPPATQANLKQRDIIALYNLARSQELRINQWHERIRACELSGRQLIPLSRAVNATALAMPRRAPINEQIIRQRITSANDGKLKALKRELRESYATSRKMLDECERLLALAKGILGEESDAGIIAWDGAAISPVLGGDEGWDEGNPYIGPVLLPTEIVDSPTSDYEPGDRPITGLVLNDAARQADWMFIDTWYVIGPFAYGSGGRPGSLDRVYGPESVLDLDQRYDGKGGRILEWRFRQTPFMRIEPFPDQISRNAIWYFYTEVWSQRDQQLWVAFGSDDYSICWVNGKKVYNADTIPHHWEPFVTSEFRKVDFKRGVNRILFKLENAGGTTGMSVIVNTDPTMPGLNNPFTRRQAG